MREWEPLSAAELSHIIADTERDEPLRDYCPDDVYRLAHEVEQARRQLAEKDLAILNQAERIAAQANLLSLRGERPYPEPEPARTYICCDCGLVETTAEEVFCVKCSARRKPNPTAFPSSSVRGVTTNPNDPALRQIRSDGQQSAYLVLSDEERAKGFVRPVRTQYKHVACGQATTMGRAIAETYAAAPHFYGGTFCAHCEKHFRLIDAQGKPTFLWEPDGSPVGS